MLGTPRVLALLERATVAAVAADLPADRTTVGVSVTLDHTRATPIGVGVEVAATLAESSGRQLVFTAQISDPQGTVAVARITRALVERSRFPR